MNFPFSHIIENFIQKTNPPIPPLPEGKEPDISLNEDDDVPLDDRVVSASILTGTAYFIKYCGSSGEISERRISIKSLKESSAGNVLIYAFCYERKQVRSFRLDKILEVTDLATGEIYDHPDSVMNILRDARIDHNDPTLNAIKQCSIALNILAFLSRCDGRQHALERDVMVHYVMEQCFFNDLDGKKLDDYIKRLYPTGIVFYACVAKAYESDKLAQILKFAVRLAEADGILHDKEFNLITELQQELAA